MAGQSLAMGEAFGKGFQYGKRKISSMSNEEFNKLNFQLLSESIHTDYKVMIPSLTQSIRDSKVLQDAVFEALADVIKDIPGQILDFFGDVTGGGTRAGLAADTSTATTTSASELGTLTEVRAGSGLGDIRDEQKAAAELVDRNKRAQILIDDAAARAAKIKHVETFTIANKPISPAEAKLARQTLWRKTIVQINNTIGNYKKQISALKLQNSKWTSQMRAIQILFQRTNVANLKAGYLRQINSLTNLIRGNESKIQNSYMNIGRQNVELAKAKKFLAA